MESWTLLKKGYLKKETEGMMMAAQDQAIRTRWVQKNIDKMDITESCRVCGDKEEFISHIVSECKQLAQKEYKVSRYDKFASILHRDICKKNGFECGDKSYEHIVDSEKRCWRMKMLRFCGIFQFKPIRNRIITGQISQ